LDPSIGAFVRVAEGMKIPPRNQCYSLNEGNRLSLPAGYQRYLQWAQENGYSSRYVGAMVADVHRILIQGGVFMYPPTKKAPGGKLRLMYEANPMAWLVEHAGGKALSAPGQRILEVQPEDIHQRTCVILGSSDEVDLVTAHLHPSSGLPAQCETGAGVEVAAHPAIGIGAAAECRLGIQDVLRAAKDPQVAVPQGIGHLQVMRPARLVPDVFRIDIVRFGLQGDRIVAAGLAEEAGAQVHGQAALAPGQ